LSPGTTPRHQDFIFRPTSSMSPPSRPIPGRPGPLSFLKNRRRGRLATRTPSTAFPNSRSRTSPRSATGIRADARAYTPARDGGLREKACSTAFPGQPAKAEPSRLCETFRCGPHNRRALQRASPRSERRSRPIPHEPAAACSVRDSAVVEPSGAEL
jgi:hypothetical protein